MWPPLAATTASHLRRIWSINRWIKDCGMLFYSCTSASRSSCSVSGGFGQWRTRLPSSSHKWSIDDRSGDNADQGRTRMWFKFIKSWQTRATWHLASSCWKTCFNYVLIIIRQNEKLCDIRTYYTTGDHIHNYQ